DWLVHSPLQRLLDLHELRAQPIATGLPLEEEATAARFGAYEGEAQEVEGLRFGKPAPLAVGRRMAAELDDAGLVRVQRQGEVRQPLAHRVQKAPRVSLVLEADDRVIGIAHDDHVARG